LAHGLVTASIWPVAFVDVDAFRFAVAFETGFAFAYVMSR